MLKYWNQELDLVFIDLFIETQSVLIVTKIKGNLNFSVKNKYAEIKILLFLNIPKDFVFPHPRITVY